MVFSAFSPFKIFFFLSASLLYVCLCWCMTGFVKSYAAWKENLFGFVNLSFLAFARSSIRSLDSLINISYCGSRCGNPSSPDTFLFWYPTRKIDRTHHRLWPMRSLGFFNFFLLPISKTFRVILGRWKCILDVRYWTQVDNLLITAGKPCFCSVLTTM